VGRCARIFSLILSGLVIGFSIAAPVGPIGVLVIRRTLANGRVVGFISGMGAATADAFYGTIAAFGLTAVSNLLIAQALWLRLFGGAFLLYLGIRTIAATFKKQDESQSPVLLSAEEKQTAIQLLPAYGSIFALTITNPLTILSFVGIFAALGAGEAETYTESALIVLGVFGGSALWWLTLSTGVSLFKRWVNEGAMVWVNRVSGGIICVAAVVALGSLLVS